MVRGSASVALVVVFPVVYGNDAEFLLGVVLLVGAFLTLPLAFGASVEVREPVGASHHGEAPSTEAGAWYSSVPFPIFFGAMEGRSPGTVMAAVALAGQFSWSD